MGPDAQVEAELGALRQDLAAERGEAQRLAGGRRQRPRVEGHAPGVAVPLYARMLVEARARGGAAALAYRGWPAAARQAAAVHLTCWAP